MSATKVADGELGADREARREAEGVGQAARGDLVGDAHIDHVGQIVARGGPAGGQADRAGKAADDGRDAHRLHPLDLLHPGLGVRARVAEHHFEFGAAQRLDAARGVDVRDRHLGAAAPQFTVLGQCAGYRLQDAQLDGVGLGPQRIEGVASAVAAAVAAPPRSS
ncbi:MAG: hypothetical protein M5U35_10625 [Roseovarius sp.]|nr:hypothetical protein [Roseovarius sp.]